MKRLVMIVAMLVALASVAKSQNLPYSNVCTTSTYNYDILN